MTAHLIRPNFAGFRPTTSRLNPGAFESWDIRAYWESATCEAVGCDHWRDGWTTTCDTSTQLGRDQADYIRRESGRRFVEELTATGVRFRFEAGQRCFASDQHRRQAAREPVYLRQVGDHRRRLGRARIYDRADQWVDDFASRTEVISGARSRAGTAGT